LVEKGFIDLTNYIRRLRMKKSLFSSVWVCLAVLTGSTYGATMNWNVNGTNDWHTSANWNPASVPGSSDIAEIKNGGTAKISTSDATANRVEIGYGSGANNNGGLILNNHTLTIIDLFRMGLNGGNGTYVQSGSSSKLDAGNKNIQIANNAPSDCTFTLNAGVVTNVSDIRCGENDHGTLTINGGDIYAKNTRIAVGSSATGTFTLNSGTLVNSKGVYVGISGAGTLNITGGELKNSEHIYVGEKDGGTGTVTVTGGKLSNGIHIFLGKVATSTGILNVDGGEVSDNVCYLGGGDGTSQDTVGYCTLSSGRIDGDQFIIGNCGTGYYTQTGGTNTVPYDLKIGRFSGSRGFATIAGGLLEPRTLYICERNGSYGELTINGGTVHTTRGMTVGKTASTEAHVIVQGGEASINIDGGDFNCRSGATNTLTFILDGNPAAISTIKCSNTAYLNNTNVTLEWKLGDDFRGEKDQEYTLIEATGGGSVQTNECNFVDLTGGHGDFELKMSSDNKKLYLIQHSKYPTEGTIIVLQ